MRNGLIVAGAAILGMSYGKAHKDAITGASLLSGTAYTLGTYEFDKRRWDIYNKGIEAVNCAKTAVLPLNLTMEDVKDLDKQLNGLEKHMGQLQGRLQVVEGVLAYLKAKYPDADALDPYKAIVKEAQSDVRSLQKIHKAGRKLHGGVIMSDNRLKSSVDQIDQRLNDALKDTVPDLSAIPKIVGGLGAMSAQFAPSQDIKDILLGSNKEESKASSGADNKEESKGETAASAKEKAESKKNQNKSISEKLKKVDDASEPGKENGLGSGTTERMLIKALESLKQPLEDSFQAALKVHGILIAFDKKVAANALDACGDASKIVLDMTLTTKSISFTKGVEDSKSVFINGGTKPYHVEIDGNNETGLTVRGPRIDESRIMINVSEKSKDIKKKEVQVLVSDASNPVKSAVLTIKLEAPKADETPAAEKPKQKGKQKASGAKPANATNAGAAAGAATVAPQAAADNSPCMGGKKKDASGNCV
ncbi:hypothetical protein V8J88_23230 [Massilia sp. W12]|uniref:hypothetical protein n=1 Tax=Massilia sp. W12 TaxID=3126507 RepID=UPI0030CC18FC